LAAADVGIIVALKKAAPKLAAVSRRVVTVRAAAEMAAGGVGSQTLRAREVKAGRPDWMISSG
jgi:hypothetical protein